MSKNKAKLGRRDFIIGSAAGAAAAALAPSAPASRAALMPHRHVDQSRCVGCANCVPLCPMGAIQFKEKSWINPDECAECGVCYRSRVCPVEAIMPGKLKWPRTLREAFSNPMAEHKATGVAGRGTEGIKTNDSTNRYRQSYMGVFVELGRPVLGARFIDVQKVVMKFKAHGFPVIPDNPVSELIADNETGALMPEILKEKVISALVEFILPAQASQELKTMIDELGNEVDSVFNVSVALRAHEDGRSPLKNLFGADTFSLPNGKVNLGMYKL